MDEDTQERITFLLQEIDANICAAHRSATQICATVRRHHHILKQIHDASQVWRPLFDSFAVQRSPPRPHAAAAATSVMTPAASASEDAAATERDEGGAVRRGRAMSDDDLMEATSLTTPMEEQFKTTTLVRLPQREADESVNSVNVSINSDHLPEMARTPYMKASGFRGIEETLRHPGEVSGISQTTSNWTPALSSPPRTNMIQTHERGQQRARTPGSALSSIPPDSPGIARNLMEVGAFESTPPRGQRRQSENADVVMEDTSELVTPVMPSFTTLSPTAAAGHAEEKEDAETLTASQRKRKRPGSPNPRTSISQIGSTADQRVPPSPLSTPSKYTSLRRKYSSTDYSTPVRSRKPEVTIDSIKKSAQKLMSESPMTPSFEMPSPLLRTQLQAMTPHTPLSNRLVGATMDVGSVAQESKLQEYEESFDAGEPVPEFQLSLFPSAFQRGIGAVQISTLYSKFQDAQDKPALSVDHLSDVLPDYGKERIEILLDTLVSRRLLRPFVVEGTMFWQIP